MQLPSPPTDSFYKFCSLSGVAIAISSAYLYVSKVYEYRDTLLQHKAELEFLSPITQWGAAIGTVLALAGFLFWFLRVQLPLDRDAKFKAELTQLQIEELKLKLELSKLQIEKEKKLQAQSGTTVMPVAQQGVPADRAKARPLNFTLSSDSPALPRDFFASTFPTLTRVGGGMKIDEFTKTYKNDIERSVVQRSPHNSKPLMRTIVSNASR